MKKKINYYAYLQSEDWKIRKKELLEQAGYICDHCGGKAILLHHLNYDNLGYEMLFVDVIALCSACHDMIHEDKIYKEYEGGQFGYGKYQA